MIEVTDEMVEAAALAFTKNPTEATYVVARRMVEASLKVHKANKPTREPLSDEQIDALVPWQGDLKDPYFSRIEFARAIEQAHGIGTPNEPT